MSSRPLVDASDLELLRHFEPVLRFTRGESYLPMRVDGYVAAASHLRRARGQPDATLATAGQLTPATLASDPAGVGREFITVAGTMEAGRLTDLFGRSGKQAVGFRRGGGRLARVGYLSRLADALFSLTLLARGRVPGSLARLAVQHYRAHHADEEPAYYGRVVRTGTWIALQYWFFYAFNDWRSGFNGANDHEADWEQIIVYCYADAGGRVAPRWVAFAQHDYHGRDLRRRWDDRAELDLVDDHPVVYPGAGSHASYFRPGEYLAEQELKLPAPLKAALNLVVRVVSGAGSAGGEKILPIAFVDFARGDGVAVGPGTERPWSPVLMDESQPWVAAYRGLWGMSVDDPFEGEEAPAGPMFNRDGTVRSSWADPVAFAELDGVPPPSQELELLGARLATIEARQEELARLVPELEERLAAAGAELGRRTTDDDGEVERLRAEVSALHGERAENVLRVADLRRQILRRRAGEEDRPQAHLRRKARPTPVGAARSGALLEAWAALSIGLLLLGLVAVLIIDPQFAVPAALGIIGAFIFIESLLQRRLSGLVVIGTRLLAVLAGLLLAVTFWQQLLIGVAIAAGLFVIRENVAELGTGG